MIAHSPNSVCKQAELYYYDFLCDESRGLVPESMVNHIGQCQRCQEQINKLKAVLSRAEGPELQQGQLSSALTTMLKLHFAYIGKPVTCNIVKPFLPTLLDPALGMRIPTPIVTHLCDCQQCSEDLDIIRCLNLNRKQLCRLSQLFAEKPSEDAMNCSQAQSSILAVLSMVFRETNAEVLKHLCTCPDCREALYQWRETVREKLLQGQRAQNQFPCEAISATDIFDYCFPYGIDPAKNQYAKFRKSFTSHAASCPNCLTKMQTLHKTISYIAERAESEVVTLYNIDKSAKTQAAGESNQLYSGFPIDVKVIKREGKEKAEQPTSTVNFAVALKQRISAMGLKPLAKTVIAAAAVILLAVALFFQTSTAKAVTLERIYKALEKVRNIHISTFAPDKTLPDQEKWVSPELSIYITKTDDTVVLWDIPNKVRKIKHLDTESIEIMPLSAEMVAEIEKVITGFLGLVPFADLSMVPDDVEWNHIVDEDLKVAEGIEVYDLIWSEEARDGSMVLNKWRFFVETKTHIPQRTELYRKEALDSDYTLESIFEVTYLEKSKIQSVIKESFF